ncbi:uncharacterized protein METZ01_LOCUS116863, partial [marine metagenome]
MTYTILPGDKAPRFEKLLATDGSLYSQEDFEDKPFKVIFFTCNHCPYVTGSDELTRKVAEEFSKNTRFVAINSNSRNTYEEDSYENMTLRMEEFNFPWIYLHDESQKIAQSFGALKTPHFFIFDQNWNLLYTGRNTDNPRDTELRKTDDLHDALVQAVTGVNITVPITN